MTKQNEIYKILGTVYIVLSVLLLLCLAPMPYGYYQLVRFIAMTVFGVIAWLHYATRHSSRLYVTEVQEGYIKDDSTTIHSKVSMAIVFGALALLFQPFFKIALGRILWNIVDVIVAGMLIIMWIKLHVSNK